MNFGHQEKEWFFENPFSDLNIPDDYRSWESPQTLPALFNGSFEYVKRFRNLKLAIRMAKNIHNKVLSSSEGPDATYLSLKANFNK